MAIWNYNCAICGCTFRTKKSNPEHCGIGAEKLLSVPSIKYMEKADPILGISALKDMDSITLERSRNHSRDHELDELIQENREHTNPHDNQWLTKDGLKRKAISDL